MSPAELSQSTQERLVYRWRHSGKTCGSCGEELPLSAFGADLTKTDGLRHSCKSCVAARRRAARARAKEAQA